MTEHIRREPHPQVPANETEAEREEREQREQQERKSGQQPKHRDPEGEHGRVKGERYGDDGEEAESTRA